MPLAVVTNLVMLAFIVAYTNELIEGAQPDEPKTAWVTLPTGSTSSTLDVVMSDTITLEARVITWPPMISGVHGEKK
jgi:hypothetical protein